MSDTYYFDDDLIKRIEKIVGKKITEDDLHALAEDALNELFAEDSDLKEL